MPIPRLHLFELEDLPWFPAAIRDLATDYLQFIEARFALHQPVVPLLRAALVASQAQRVVDLCSGGGGPVLALQQALAASGIAMPITLTDKYPNLTAFQRLSSLPSHTISYLAEPCEANQVPPELTGFRTLFNAFHHFAPAAARSILACAVRSRQPIGIFEIPDRSLASLAPLLFTPLFVAIATPFIRPFAWRRLLWTYAVPLVPLTCWWDGLVSQLRAYTATEMLDLARDFPAYDWQAGRVPIDGTAGNVTYLIGIPNARTA